MLSLEHVNNLILNSYWAYWKRNRIKLNSTNFLCMESIGDIRWQAFYNRKKSWKSLPAPIIENYKFYWKGKIHLTLLNDFCLCLNCWHKLSLKYYNYKKMRYIFCWRYNTRWWSYTRFCTFEIPYLVDWRFMIIFRLHIRQRKLNLTFLGK